jgi:hypothetical protein
MHLLPLILVIIGTLLASVLIWSHIKKTRVELDLVDRRRRNLDSLEKTILND